MGKDISTLSREEVKQFRREIQAVFQNPFSSLNPRMKVREIVGEPLITNNLAKGVSLCERVFELLEMVGLRREDVDKYPHQFSGGQRQRIAIARALSSGPTLIVLDEPVSSLDVSIRAQILNLLRELKQQFNLTYVFIAHDLNLVYYMAEQVVVMYLGETVEVGETEKVFFNPAHPYTQALLSAVPIPDPQRNFIGEIVEGDPLDASTEVKGCIFATRCKYVTENCHLGNPSLHLVEPDHFSACNLSTTFFRQRISR
jgi:oligopeptide/dipeptide ABC transporter ATP-binding protein